MTTEKVDLAYFSGLPTKALLATQIKLTYVGVQEKPTPSVGILVSGNTFDISRFRPFRRESINYGNDQVASPELCVLTAAEYPAVYRVILDKSHNALKTSVRPFLSITLIHPDVEVRGFDVLMERQEAAQTLKDIQSRVPGNLPALVVLQNFQNRIF